MDHLQGRRDAADGRTADLDCNAAAAQRARLLALPKAERLAALLSESRRVPERGQRTARRSGTQRAIRTSTGLPGRTRRFRRRALTRPLAEDPDEVYRALLNVILRLVFLLYAEEREMLPEEETFTRYYSLAGLYERLREDDAHYPDTMNQRYGAWAQLLVLFRMVFDGAETGETTIPERHGELFDPIATRSSKVAGRTTSRQKGERIEAAAGTRRDCFPRARSTAGP